MLYSTTTRQQVDQVDGALTIQKLLEAKRRLEALCPYRQYMLSKGCSPDDGWVLVMPASKKQDAPSYVRFTLVCPMDTMYLVNPKAAGLEF